MLRSILLHLLKRQQTTSTDLARQSLAKFFLNQPRYKPILHPQPPVLIHLLKKLLIAMKNRRSRLSPSKLFLNLLRCKFHHPKSH